MNPVSSSEEPWRFLPPFLRKAVQRLGYEKPTPVQAAALPPVLDGKSLRIIAPTGTGKTLVYLLAALRARREGPGPLLVLLPTRELAYQAEAMAGALSPDLAKDLVLLIGGHDVEEQRQRLRQRPRLLLGTPGRILDILGQEPRLLQGLRLLVVDEFDKLLSLGFGEQLALILKYLPEAEAAPPSSTAAESPQRLLLSATSFEEAARVDPLLADLPLLMAGSLGNEEALQEAFHFLKSNRKKGDLLLAELRDLLQDGREAEGDEEAEGDPEAEGRRGGARPQAMVFVKNREKANHLNGLLRLRGFASETLHGKLPQPDRARIFQAFREGRFPVLVATDLAARGLDIVEVALVVNFDLPRNYRDYVHRLGRTGRAGRGGRCLSYAGPDEYLPMRNILEEYPGDLPVHPAFAHREPWLAQARRVHEAKVREEKKKESIRRRQTEEED